jgi:hypothetical protein
VLAEPARSVKRRPLAHDRGSAAPRTAISSTAGALGFAQNEQRVRRTRRGCSSGKAAVTTSADDAARVTACGQTRSRQARPAGPAESRQSPIAGLTRTPAERARYLCSAAAVCRLTRRPYGRSDRAKRSRGWAGPDDPDRGIAKAPPEQAGEPKQSCRAQAAHAWMARSRQRGQRGWQRSTAPVMPTHDRVDGDRQLTFALVLGGGLRSWRAIGPPGLGL